MTNIEELVLNETDDITVKFRDAVQGALSPVVDSLDIRDHYVGVRWTATGNVVKTSYVPWSNIISIEQVS